MNQEDRELLLKDLCARLPYGVVCDIYNDTCTIKEKLLFGGISHFANDTICVRPYLRPMSSMTEEEKREYSLTKKLSIVDYPTLESFDWLLKNHFDFRGLIPKDLAIEVTEENNPYKN